MCLPKTLSPVFKFAFIFSVPLIFTLLAASILHFLTAVKNFQFFFQRNPSPLFSITRSSSFSVIHVNVSIKNNFEKETTLFFFFPLKVRVAMRFPRK